nr:7814_t:CDS:2 [Entrophospora candida]
MAFWSANESEDSAVTKTVNCQPYTKRRKCESEETPGNKGEEESGSSEYEAEKKNKLLEAFLNLQKSR